MSTQLNKWYTFDASWYSRDMVEHESYEDAIKYIANDAVYYINNEKCIISYRTKVSF